MGDCYVIDRNSTNNGIRERFKLIVICVYEDVLRHNLSSSHTALPAILIFPSGIAWYDSFISFMVRVLIVTFSIGTSYTRDAKSIFSLDTLFLLLVYSLKSGDAQMIAVEKTAMDRWEYHCLCSSRSEMETAASVSPAWDDIAEHRMSYAQLPEQL